MAVKISDLKVNWMLYSDDEVLNTSSEFKSKALVTLLKKVCENGLSLNACVKILEKANEENVDMTEEKLNKSVNVLELRSLH